MTGFSTSIHNYLIEGDKNKKFMAFTKESFYLTTSYI